MKTIRGSKPAAWQERRKIEASGHEPVEPRIQLSPDEVLELQRALGRHRMVARQRDVHRVVEQRHAVDAVVGVGAEARADVERDVEVAAAQEVHAVLGLDGRERQLDARVALAEAGDRGRHDRAPGARERAQAQAPAAQAGDRLELGLGVGQAREDHVGVGDERPAGLGEVDPARAALDELGARLALQGRDLLGDRGLRVVQRVGGGGERTPAGDLAQDPHAADVEH